MSQLFDSLEKSNLQDLMDEQLKRQVDMVWPKEAICLEGHGLADANEVLDIGTGNGYFLSRLAQRYPKKNFIGIDPSAPLVDIANRRLKESDLKNATVMKLEAPDAPLNRKFDFIFARLALYCAPRRNEIIKWANNLLNEGGRMCIIDVDDSYAYCYPDRPEWNIVFGAMKKKADSAGADRWLGKKLPHLLLKSGFDNIKFEHRFWFTNLELSPNDFYEFWSSTATFISKLVPDAISAGELKAFIKLLDEIKGDGSIAINPMIIASGRA